MASADATTAIKRRKTATDAAVKVRKTEKSASVPAKKTTPEESDKEDTAEDKEDAEDVEEITREDVKEITLEDVDAQEEPAAKKTFKDLVRARARLLARNSCR